MSLITQCPACNTLFKVVPDQLKISQGWVRCGQCREVFDAQAQMTSISGVASIAQPDDSQPHEADTSQAPNSADAKFDSNPLLDTAQPKDSIPKNQDFASSDWINSVNPPQPTAQDTDYPELDNPPSVMPGDAIESVSSPVQQTKSAPSFVRQAQRSKRLRSPWARALLLCTALVLLLAGVVQIARQERDRLAAAQPSLRPVLQTLCSYAACSIGPLKQIEYVVIDASGFNKMRSDGKSEVYKITVNLKNTHVLPLALPHIELTLNDSQDQALMRRVLNPADLGATQLVIAPAGEFSGSGTLQIDNLQLSGARVSGYRVLAFYP